MFISDKQMPYFADIFFTELIFYRLIFLMRGYCVLLCNLYSYDAFLKRLSQKLSTKLDQSHSNTVGYLRRKLRIELLNTVLMAVRGYRKSKTVNISDLDLHLLSYCVK